MNDRPNHRAAAERMLADADEWTAQAGEPMPEAGELSCLAYAAVHALLAIHDTLTAADPTPNPLTVTHPWPPWPSTLPDVTGADRYAANEERQREAEADPLDENDHRDRMTPDGTEWRRTIAGCWHPTISNVQSRHRCHKNLAYIQSLHGPLTFAPDTAPQATGDDLSASESESGSVEGEGADDASGALLCPECGDHINTHNMNGCRFVLCACPRTPEDVARPFIEQAVNIERIRMTAQLRQVISSVQDSGNLAELDALADAWEAGNDG